MGRLLFAGEPRPSPHAPGKRITVEHHAGEHVEVPPPPSWDASRTTPVPALPAARLRQMVAEDTGRRVRRALRQNRTAAPAWDVGERPKVRMKHFELERTQPAAPRVSLRSSDERREQAVREMPRWAESLLRRYRVAQLSFGSPLHKPYEPLGRVETDPEGARVRPRREGHLVIVDPDEMEEIAEKRAEGKPTWLRHVANPHPAPAMPPALKYAQKRDPIATEPVRDALRAGEVARFAVSVPSGYQLHLRCEPLSGEPAALDVFVSRLHKNPTSMDATWRSDAAGDERIERVVVTPDDPDARHGNYYICVSALKPVEFVLSATLPPHEITMPPRAAPSNELGFGQLARQLHRAEQRVKSARHGRSSEDDLGVAEMPDASRARLVEAGREAARLLREHSAVSRRGEPRRATQLALSRSLGELAPSGGATAAERGESGARAATGASSAASDSSSDGSPARARGRRGDAQLSWRPPDGYDWNDLPVGSRLKQVMSESSLLKTALTSRVGEQLREIESSRPLRQQLRARSLAALDPLAAVCGPSAVRQGTDAAMRLYQSGAEVDAEDRPGTAPSRTPRSRAASADRMSGAADAPTEKAEATVRRLSHAPGAGESLSGLLRGLELELEQRGVQGVGRRSRRGSAASAAPSRRNSRASSLSRGSSRRGSAMLLGSPSG